MAEVINVLVAFAVIVFLFRWVTSSMSSSNSSGDTVAALGFRPKNITQEMVDTIHAMFPDIPIDNIRFDLLRTGSVELTSNKILEKGYLDVPPASYYTVYPRTDQQSNAQTANNTAGGGKSTTQKPKKSLISRYKLEDRVISDAPEVLEEKVGGKAVWEDTAEKREASLRERKAQMILAARQRLLAQQQETASGSNQS